MASSTSARRAGAIPRGSGSSTRRDAPERASWSTTPRSSTRSNSTPPSTPSRGRAPSPAGASGRRMVSGLPPSSPQIITHEKQLVTARPETIAFLEAMTQLDQKLGPLLLQMPPSFAAGAVRRADGLPGRACPPAFAMPSKSAIARGWRQDTLPQLLDLLQQQGVALCLVQHAWMPRSTRSPRRSSTSAGWAAARTSPTTTSAHVRINRGRAARRLGGADQRLPAAGLIVYGYFNNHYQGHSPASVRGPASAAAGRRLSHRKPRKYF